MLNVSLNTLHFYFSTQNPRIGTLGYNPRGTQLREGIPMHPFWIATHDPHGPDDEWHVYLKSRDRSGGVPERGHKVLFYETENVGPDGRKGRKAIVCAGEVTGRLQERIPPKGDWRYELPCGELEHAAKLVGRDEMLSSLGLKLTMPLFTWKGLKNLSQAQYFKLRELMGLANSR
jgi:hypothetical protein